MVNTRKNVHANYMSRNTGLQKRQQKSGNHNPSPLPPASCFYKPGRWQSSTDMRLPGDLDYLGKYIELSPRASYGPLKIFRKWDELGRVTKLRVYLTLSVFRKMSRKLWKFRYFWRKRWSHNIYIMLQFCIQKHIFIRNKWLLNYVIYFLIIYIVFE